MPPRSDHTTNRKTGTSSRAARPRTDEKRRPAPAASTSRRRGADQTEAVKPVAKAYVAYAPERLVWGSDWPHPTEPDTKPDDAVLLDLLQEWVPDEATRRKILVENPAKLYGF